MEGTIQTPEGSRSLLPSSSAMMMAFWDGLLVFAWKMANSGSLLKSGFIQFVYIAAH